MPLFPLGQIIAFPAADLALSDPNGLLAIGGDLSPERLVLAYRSGIFPWYEPEQALLWWSPDPRFGEYCSQLKPSRSLAKLIRRTPLKITVNVDFDGVIKQCAQLRQTQGTWITQDMMAAYCSLHKMGHAHSVEVWQENELVGGFYGIGVGQMFCGESMFHVVSNASKLALFVFAKHFERHGGLYIDAQMETPHLRSLGMQSMSRKQYLDLLARLKAQEVDNCTWHRQRLL